MTLSAQSEVPADPALGFLGRPGVRPCHRRRRRAGRRRSARGHGPVHRHGDRPRRAWHRELTWTGRWPRRGQALPGWRRRTPADRAEVLNRLADVVDASPGRAGPLSSRATSASRCPSPGGDPGVQRDAPVHGRSRAGAAGTGHRRVRHRSSVDDPPRAARRGRGHHPVELPARHGVLEDRRRPGDGQHRGAQAVRADPAHHPAADGARRRRPARRGRQRGRRYRPRGGRGHLRTPASTWSR